MPLDVPDTPNLTWTVTKPVAGGTQIDGFTATTRMGHDGGGQYAAAGHAPIAGDPLALLLVGRHAITAKASKQAVISALPTPSFLAEVK